MVRARGQREDGLVGEVGHGVEPRDRRHCRRGSRGHHETAGADLDALPDHDGAAILEARRALDHAHTEPGESRLAVVGSDGGDHVMEVLVQARKVDRGRSRDDAELRGLGDGMGAPRRGDQRLRRHAAAVEALAPHLALLDQHDRDPEGGGGSSHRKPARARSDHADVWFQALRHGDPDGNWRWTDITFGGRA